LSSHVKQKKLSCNKKKNQPTTSKDILEILIGSITVSRRGKIKEAFNRFIQDISAKLNFQNSITNYQVLVNMIYANSTKLKLVSSFIFFNI